MKVEVGKVYRLTATFSDSTKWIDGTKLLIVEISPNNWVRAVNVDDGEMVGFSQGSWVADHLRLV